MNTLPIPYIKFAYLHATLLARLKEETQYRARLIKDKEGQSMIDDIAFTDDETDILDRYIKDAVFKVGEKIINLNDGLGLSLSEAVYTSSTEVGVCVINHEVYNDNRLTVIDRECEKIIQHYMLSMWWEKCGMFDDMKVNAAKMDIALNNLTELIWELRIPDIDTSPTAISVSGDVFSEEQTVTFLSGVAKTVTFTQDYNTTNYFVYAYDAGGLSIPGFDSLITTRLGTGFTVTLSKSYPNAIVIVVGSTTEEVTGTTKTQVVVCTGVTASVSKSVPHSFGSTTYFAQAIQADGTNVPGFDDMITTRDVDRLIFTSLTAYSSLTIILIGIE